MRREAVFPSDVDSQARDLLLTHWNKGLQQEHLCFGLWRQSTGAKRQSSIIYEIIPPKSGETILHGNVSFTADYLTRAIRLACHKKSGLVFMHNHLTPGWQEMSEPDINAEQERISPPARATGYPVLGLTLGTDGSWSGRLWLWDGSGFKSVWCDKVRIAGKHFRVTFNEESMPAPKRRRILQRTIDTWGIKCQNDLSRLRFGVIGIGSVGSIIAEALARMGIGQIVLIDPDQVEEHNLDRLLHAGVENIGQYKVRVAAQRLNVSCTAEQIDMEIHALPIEHETALLAALDCDILFSAVDRPLPKDIINRIAYAHCIPVISGGVFIDGKSDGTLGQASWSVTTVGPENRCLRCDGQYTSSDVLSERDGSLDNPAYLRESRQGDTPANQNVFAFCANLASSMVIQMTKLVVADSWWPNPASKIHYSLIPGRLEQKEETCKPDCSIFETQALADECEIPFIKKSVISKIPPSTPYSRIACIRRIIKNLFDSWPRSPNSV